MEASYLIWQLLIPLILSLLALSARWLKQNTNQRIAQAKAYGQREKQRELLAKRAK